MSDPWSDLRQFTQARIALGRCGHALPTEALLDFQLAHAQARDAVHFPWNVDQFARQLIGLEEKVLILETPISNRSEYLRRPDLGRILTAESRTLLANFSVGQADVALIVSNGLSSTAVERHGIALLQAILDGFKLQRISLALVALVANGRVALADEIGSLLACRVSVIIVGERPGLSASDSLGIYLTYAPRKGNTDAERNCISNVRPPEGMGYAAAASKLLYLTGEALRRGISGVALKDDMGSLIGKAL